MSDPLLVQYQVFAQRGMHFGRLYWQSIAFHLVVLLAAAALFRDLSGMWLSGALLVAGAATLLMAFVVSRLWVQESRFEALLTNLETELRGQGYAAIQIAPSAGRRGARYAVNLAIGLLGAVLTVAGLIVLATPAAQSAM